MFRTTNYLSILNVSKGYSTIIVARTKNVMQNTGFSILKTTSTISTCSVDCNLTIISFINNTEENLVSILHTAKPFELKHHFERTIRID